MVGWLCTLPLSREIKPYLQQQQLPFRRKDRDNSPKSLLLRYRYGEDRALCCAGTAPQDLSLRYRFGKGSALKSSACAGDAVENESHGARLDGSPGRPPKDPAAEGIFLLLLATPLGTI
jgi:hypothetical protein